MTGLFKTDENLPSEVAVMLRDAGHDACSVLDQGMLGVKDPRVAAVCREEGRCIVTLDLDFSDLRMCPPEEYAGIIVLRIARQNRSNILDVMARVVRLVANGQPVGRLWIVDEVSVRVRD